MGTAGELRSVVRRELTLAPRRRRVRAASLLRLSTLTALLWSVFAGPAAAQPPYRQEVLRGFSSLDVGVESKPDLVDLDADGDLDVVVGERFGSLRCFENAGSSTAPAYRERTGTENPFFGIYAGLHGDPSLGDLDGDGDPDVVVGEQFGALKYYANTGSATTPAFAERTGTGNPFAAINVGVFGSPDLVDLDGDGDLDLVVGVYDGPLSYFTNTGSPAVPLFLAQTGTASPFNGIAGSYYSSPDLEDLDGDGDLELVVGERYGTLRYFANTGSSNAPAFAEQIGTLNPLNGQIVGDFSSPDLADLDGDGDLDLVVGDVDGTLETFVNSGTPSAPAFVPPSGTTSPLFGIDVGDRSGPDLADLDGDGDLDAVVGELDGVLNYYLNTGSSSAPAFLEQAGTESPFAGIDVGGESAPDLADLEGDGDLDAVVGESYGSLEYFANTGTASAPAFVERSGSANPFAGIDVGNRSAPDLADLDGDGDLDAVVGNRSGALPYLDNTGSSSAPAFIERTGTASPFNGLDVARSSSPELVDLDRDRDLDAVVGRELGSLSHFANTGSSSAPAFVEQTGTANPFAGIDLGDASDPDLADLDGDGDLDLICGESAGHLVFYRSLDVLLGDGFEQGGTAAWSTTSP